MTAPKSPAVGLRIPGPVVEENYNFGVLQARLQYPQNTPRNVLQENMDAFASRMSGGRIGGSPGEIPPKPTTTTGTRRPLSEAQKKKLAEAMKARHAAKLAAGGTAEGATGTTAATTPAKRGRRPKVATATA